jgi:hypothetical protein
MTPEACGRSVVGLFHFIPLNALAMPQKTYWGRSPQQSTKNPEFPFFCPLIFLPFFWLQRRSSGPAIQQ